jgi:hypothetical protein
MKWRCTQGHTWLTSPNQRVPNGTNCPSCAIYSFDPNSKAWFYLLEHPKWGLLQIGVSNKIERRLDEHSSLGWQLIEIYGPKTGHTIKTLEKAALNSLKRRKANFEIEKIAGKFNGYTESWVADSFPVKSIKQLMRLVEEDE